MNITAIIIGIIVALLVFTIALPFAVLGLFNYLVVPAFDVNSIDYLQAMGMIYLVTLGIGVVRVWDKFTGQAE